MWQRTPAFRRKKYGCSGNLWAKHRRHPPGQLGMTPHWPRQLAFRPNPGVRIRDQRAKHCMVELMTATHRAVGGEQWTACQGEVANRIKHLVADEFIREAGTLRVEDTVIGNDKGVLE